MSTPDRTMLRARSLGKSFVMHGRGGLRLPVFAGIDLDVAAGECVVLDGPSGCGKSTLMRCLVGNYVPTAGTVQVRHEGRWVAIGEDDPRAVLDVRRKTIGFVSQFLRVIPRVPTLELVAEPLRRIGVEADAARGQAREMLARLDLPQRLWGLPPATFSGGEQQRVNLARGLVARRPLLLLDEPTSALDGANRRLAVEAIRAARDAGCAVIAIFHDAEVRQALATRALTLQPRGEPSPRPAAAAFTSLSS